MITRSDNTAANCLIDFAQRPKINELLHSYGWQGSEVTRKFLKRPVEDEAYRKVARHADAAPFTRPTFSTAFAREPSLAPG